MLNRGNNGAQPHANGRSSAIERMRAETLDVLVVGGGIVGSGVARDAAMRGLRTALIDRHGRLVKVLPGTDWTPDQLLKEILAADAGR